MSAYVDGILREWGERYDWSPQFSRPRSKQTSTIVIPIRSGQGSAGKTRGTLNGMSHKAPEVIVKFGAGAKTRSGVESSVHYIGRTDDKAQSKEVEPILIKDQDGNMYLGKYEVQQAINDFNDLGHPVSNVKGKLQTLPIKLSMPAGTDPLSVLHAAEDYLKKTFGKDGHQYLYALHTDTPHPHVHVVLKRKRLDGKVYHPTRANWHRARTYFAYALKQHGIEAKATPNRARGQSPIGTNYGNHQKRKLIDWKPVHQLPDNQEKARKADLAKVIDALRVSGSPQDRDLAKALHADLTKIQINPKGTHDRSNPLGTGAPGDSLGNRAGLSRSELDAYQRNLRAFSRRSAAANCRGMQTVSSRIVVSIHKRSEDVLPHHAQLDLRQQGTGNLRDALRRKDASRERGPSR